MHEQTNILGIHLIRVSYIFHGNNVQFPIFRCYILQDPSTHFDLTFVFPLFNEAGFFLSQRFNSTSLVLYMPAVANSLLSVSMGYYDNPSIAPSSIYEGSQYEARLRNKGEREREKKKIHSSIRSRELLLLHHQKKSFLLSPGYLSRTSL